MKLFLLSFLAVCLTGLAQPQGATRAWVIDYVSTHGGGTNTGIVGTFLSSGTPVDTAVVIYNGTSGTNAKPSGITVGNSTNLNVPGAASVNSLVSTQTVTAANFVSTGSGAGAWSFADGAGLFYRITTQPMGTNVNVILQNNPWSGFWLGTLSSGTNVTLVSTNLGGDVTSSGNLVTVNKVQGTAVSSTAPTQSQGMRYNALTAQWEAVTLADLQPCLAVATANVASLSGTTTSDSLALVAGNRILLTAQSTASQNGPWTIAAGAWTRPTTYAAGQSVSPSATVQIVGGTVYAGTFWQLSGTTASVTVDTTSTTWSQFAPKASSSVFGQVKVDNTTIVSTNGVISAISSGGGIANTVLNSGASTANSIPINSDTTGTNVIPSKVTVTGLTNLFAGTLTSAGTITSGGTISSGGTVTSANGFAITSGGGLNLGVSDYIQFSTSTAMKAPLNGSFVLYNAAVSKIGTLQANPTNITVTASTKTLVATDSGVTWDNNGASALSTYTLPASVRGECFWFHVATAQPLAVVAAGSDVVKCGQITTAAAGGVTNSIVGSAIYVYCDVAGTWIGEIRSGTWAVSGAGVYDTVFVNKHCLTKWLLGTNSVALTSQATLQDLGSLYIPVLASHNYIVEIFLPYTEAGLTAGLNVGINVPTSPTAWIVSGETYDDNLGTLINTGTVTASGSVINAATTHGGHTVLRGTLENGTTAGNVQIQYAQKTSDGSATQITRGAFIRVTPEN